ncbi:RHS repeat-associated core domain-containing protein [Pseudomonas sp. NPDC007930]|uniref:RHS repeat-associated core domain-containing protein n=1 Tax=Pseudomonas sp. NPDC007930 TaxID=3364417 RepID=UPI0036E1FC28
MTQIKTDSHGTPLVPYGFSAYGFRHRANTRQGFNGQLEANTPGIYSLGHGRRAYSAVLRRFLQPDTLSPFSRGGLNTYCYCGAEPVNRLDPSGGSFFNALKLLGKGIARTVKVAAAPSQRAEVHFLGGELAAFSHKPGVATVVAHGRPGSLYHGERALAPGELQSLLEPTGLLDDAHTIRLLVCDSATRPDIGISFAEALANHTQLRVKGYRGVTSVYEPDTFERLLGLGASSTESPIGLPMVTSTHSSRWLYQSTMVHPNR